MSALPTTDLLTAARAGDESAFAALVEPHRRDLHAHCYRMLGSLQDAEDALQDALLRAWRGLGRLRGPRASMRTWLYRIATNACLDLARGAAGRGSCRSTTGRPPTRRRAPARPDRVGAGRARSGRPAYEQRESVELAFVAALQHLPASQRAVLILREVLGFSAREVADTLETRWRRSTAPCSGRARRWTSACRPRASRPPCARWATSGWSSL